MIKKLSHFNPQPFNPEKSIFVYQKVFGLQKNTFSQSFNTFFNYQEQDFPQ